MAMPAIQMAMPAVQMAMPAIQMAMPAVQMAMPAVQMAMPARWSEPQSRSSCLLSREQVSHRLPEQSGCLVLP
jgi:hypothetical protein